MKIIMICHDMRTGRSSNIRGRWTHLAARRWLFIHIHARAYRYSSQSVPTHIMYTRMGIRIKQIAHRIIIIVLSYFCERELLLCTRAVFDNNVGLIMPEEESTGPPGGPSCCTHIHVHRVYMYVCTYVLQYCSQSNSNGLDVYSGYFDQTN